MLKRKPRKPIILKAIAEFRPLHPGAGWSGVVSARKTSKGPKSGANVKSPDSSGASVPLGVNPFDRFSLSSRRSEDSTIFVSALIAIIGILFASLALPAEARDQWQIQRHGSPPTAPYPGWNPGTPPGVESQVPGLSPIQDPGANGQMPGMVNGSGAQGSNFLDSMMTGNVFQGTMLTGVVDADLDSSKSKKGDIFAVILEHGYSNQGKMVIPPGSRILGTVVDAFPAKLMRNGMPGRLNVNLQTLAFPDGSTTAFSGFLEHNPAHNQTSEIKTRSSGFNLSDYGQSVRGMLGSFGGGVGFLHARRMRGKEFVIEKGTEVAIKVNRRIDLQKMSKISDIPGLISEDQAASTMQMAPSWLNRGNQPPPSSGVPGLVGPDPQAPGNGGMFGAGAPVAPGMVNQQPSSGVPGLVGSSPAGGMGYSASNPGFDMSTPSSGYGQPPQGGDPNDVFNRPLGSAQAPQQNSMGSGGMSSLQSNPF